MFCPKCGREGDGLCLSCYLEGNPIYMRDSELLLCNCGNACFRGTWGYKTKDILPKIVEENLVVPGEIRLGDYSFKSDAGEKKIILRILVTGVYKGERFTRVIPGRIKVMRGSCPVCGRISGGYYESILQLRVHSPHKLFKEVIDPLQVINAERVRGGVDIYLASSSYGKKIAKELREKGFLIKESSKLLGCRKGKEIHRTSISVKEPAFSVGDFISRGKRILQVTAGGRKVGLRDVVSGKKVSLGLNELSDTKPDAKASDARRCIITSVSPRELQLLNLDTQETIEIRNNKQGVAQGDEVDYIEIKGKGYIVD